MSNFVSYLKEYHPLSLAFKYVIDNNEGAYNPYHNTFHLLDVFLTSMQISNTSDGLEDKDIIEIGLAALFHDFNHSAGKLNDNDNINLAINGLNDFLLKNKELVKSYNIDEFKIEELILITEFPHKSEPKCIKEKIIRDSDMIQCYNKNWFSNIITGFFMKESNKTIQEAIESQIRYIQNIKYYTSHAKYIHKKEQEKMFENLYYLANIYK